MEQHLGVCILVTNSQNQVLLGKRKNAYKAGYFGIPGGRVEVGEKLLECAKRELQEECGITSDALEIIGFIKENQGEYDFIHFVATVTIDQVHVENIEEDKCEGWEWYDLSSLPTPLLAGHEAAIKVWREKLEFIEL